MSSSVRDLVQASDSSVLSSTSVRVSEKAKDARTLSLLAAAGMQV